VKHKTRSAAVKKYIWILCAALAAGSPAEEEPAEARKARVIDQLQQLMQPVEVPPSQEDDDTAYLRTVAGPDQRATLIYRCRYTRSKDLIDGVESVISKTGIVEESEDQNMLVINDVAAKMEELEQVVLALDAPVPQILVEARVIEVYSSEDLEKELSFNYNKADLDANGAVYNSAEGTYQLPVSGPQASVLDFSPYSMGMAGAYNRMHIFLKWLQTANDAKILSSPNLTVSLGSTASIVTGDELPIQTTSTTGNTVNNDIKYKRTGIRLDVTPARINENTVHLKVNPDVSTVTRYETFNDIRTPVISVRNVDTELSLRDGEVIMLGGLYSTESLKTRKRVPLLGSIPLVRYFFTANEDSSLVKQLVFFMKVNIVQRSTETFVDIEQNAQAVRAAGRVMEEAEALFPDGTSK
jgi:type II secretory pathway component GspD/PulD (secretin)